MARQGMAKHSAVPSIDVSQLVIETRGLSETEVAAVTAVLSAALREQAAANHPAADAARTSWQRSQRGLRNPLDRGTDAWRNSTR